MTKMNPICGSCGVTKTPSDFYTDRKKRNGLSTYCKDCCKVRAKANYAANPARSHAAHRAWVAKNRDRVREHKLKSAYGLSAAVYRQMPKVCTICGSLDRLRVDHSHQSGCVRGLLCDACNKGLGFFKDNPALLDRAANYILGAAKPDIFEATYEAA